MSIAHLKIKTQENNNVHFDGWGNDYTLCGLEITGDERLGISAAIEVKTKVNCKQCIAVVNICHQIKKSEFKN